jgi:hypothetical protein
MINSKAEVTEWCCSNIKVVIPLRQLNTIKLTETASSKYQSLSIVCHRTHTRMIRQNFNNTQRMGMQL